MKVTRVALTALTAASTVFAYLSRGTTTSAFTSTGRSTTTFVGKSILLTRPSMSFITKQRGGGMTMFFGNMFGGGGGYAQKIDYTGLDHPGPELGKLAENNQVVGTSERDEHLMIATFAGGCFWGLELAYQRVPGVVYTAVGYAQGEETNPNYGQVCSGSTGHTEAVIVYYDPKETTYEKLLDTFFERVDPTTVNGQGNDRGRQYRTGVYYHTPEQESIAKKRFEMEQSNYKKPIASECLAAKPFWPAEKYHQQYLEKGGRFNMPQDASKGATDTIRCYG